MSFLLDETASDLILQIHSDVPECGGKQFPAHSLILANQSKYFRSQFYGAGKWKKGSTDTDEKDDKDGKDERTIVVLHEAANEVKLVEHFLRQMYEPGLEDIPADLMVRLYILTDFYDMSWFQTHVIEETAEFFQNARTDENDDDLKRCCDLCQEALDWKIQDPHFWNNIAETFRFCNWIKTWANKLPLSASMAFIEHLLASNDFYLHEDQIWKWIDIILTSHGDEIDMETRKRWGTLLRLPLFIRDCHLHSIRKSQLFSDADILSAMDIVGREEAFADRPHMLEPRSARITARYND